MITRINAKNALDYQRLFEKATKVIRDNEAIELPAGMTWDDFSISSLNQYYAYLTDILEAVAKNNNDDEERKLVKQAFYVRLPLDEEFLSINADTRTITVPSSFSRYGIGVQGDEFAEILYFKIDRFFDRTDLANDAIKIAIQWETKDANKQTIKGFTGNFGKDIETEPGSIIFGWPISGELTQTNGTIKFAVRFYSIGTDKEDNNKSIFTYSFMTLPAEITINSTLDYNLLDNITNELDYGKTILNRINSSGIYDPSLPIPEEPIITTHLFAQNNTGNIVDLPTDGSGVKLAIAAHPETNGVIVYNWQKYAYNTETGNYSAQAGELPSIDEVVTDYIEEVNDIPEDTNAWYYEKINDIYELVNLNNFEKENGNYIHYTNGFLVDDGTSTYKKLYKQYNIAIVHSVGKYGVEIFAKVLTNSTSITDENIITIPGPLKPVISQEVQHKISDNGEAVELIATATAGEAGKSAEEVGTNPQVDLIYSWKKKENDTYVDVLDLTTPVEILSVDKIDGENTAAVNNQTKAQITQTGNTVTVYLTETLEEYENEEENVGKWLILNIHQDENTNITYYLDTDSTSTEKTLENDVTLTFVVTDTKPNQPYFGEGQKSITFPTLPSENLDVSYVAEITAIRNYVSTTERSGEYHITNSPVKPRIFIRDYQNGQFVNVEINTNPEDPYYSRLNYRSQNKVLSFSVQPLALGELSYIWMRLKADENVESDWENNAVKLQVDLIDALADVQASIGANPTGDPDIPVEEAVLKALNNLPAIGDPTDANYIDNGPAYRLKDTDPDGIYYCVVVNKLNNHISTNVSPFFIVQ